METNKSNRSVTQVIATAPSAGSQSSRPTILRLALFCSVFASAHLPTTGQAQSGTIDPATVDIHQRYSVTAATEYSTTYSSGNVVAEVPVATATDADGNTYLLSSLNWTKNVADGSLYGRNISYKRTFLRKFSPGGTLLFKRERMLVCKETGLYESWGDGSERLVSEGSCGSQLAEPTPDQGVGGAALAIDSNGGVMIACNRVASNPSADGHSGYDRSVMFAKFFPSGAHEGTYFAPDPQSDASPWEESSVVQSLRVLPDNTFAALIRNFRVSKSNAGGQYLAAHDQTVVEHLSNSGNFLGRNMFGTETTDGSDPTRKTLNAEPLGLGSNLASEIYVVTNETPTMVDSAANTQPKYGGPLRYALRRIDGDGVVSERFVSYGSQDQYGGNRTVSGDVWERVAVDGTGQVYAAGSTAPVMNEQTGNTTQSPFVRKFSSDLQGDLWRTVIPVTTGNAVGNLGGLELSPVGVTMIYRVATAKSVISRLALSDGGVTLRIDSPFEVYSQAGFATDGAGNIFGVGTRNESGTFQSGYFKYAENGDLQFLKRMALGFSSGTYDTLTRLMLFPQNRPFLAARLKGESEDQLVGLEFDNPANVYGTPAAGSADLAVSVSDSPDPAGAGVDVTYHVTVNNAGPDAATRVRARFTCQNGTFVSTSVGDPTLSNGEYTITLPEIASGGSTTFDVVFTARKPDADQAQQMTFGIFVFSDATDPQNGNNSLITTTGILPTSLGNISTRVRVGSGDNVLIGGFIVTGAPGSTKKVMVRAIGPSLGNAGVSGALQDPTVEIHDSQGQVTTNDDWKISQAQQFSDDEQQARVNASTVPPSDDREAALVLDLPPGPTTGVVRGKGGESGIALVEVYDLDAQELVQLANISTRGKVETGNDVMIGGVIVLGDAPSKLIIRAIGPSLANSGVQNVLADPLLELRNLNGELLAFNDDWQTDSSGESQEQEVNRTTVAPNDARESAVVVTLSQGLYTAIIRGKADENGNPTTGVALVEAYKL